MKTKIYLSFIVLACLSFALGCSSKKSNNVDPTPYSPAATVEIQNFAFSPATVNIKVGQSVTWKNLDTAPHTATDLGNAFDSGTLSTNQTYSFTFKTAGTYTYHCLIHSMMANASVVVTQ
ncbi:MAG TPA: cupredoxin family copper-binding protein [Mucilaginibacter sp.]|nr:cupredoxin family copper-binding protein [Mucilaginibacter sp.]